MARSATTGQDGIDLQGYRDYRGVPVVGAWLWDEDLGLGLATEMDINEAYEPTRRIRNLELYLLVAVTGVIAVLLLILRRRARYRAANQAYEEALSARQDLMAIVAHDLKNPINSLVLRSYLMMKKVDENDISNEDLSKNLRLINRTAHQMNTLISDLTDVTRMQAGRLNLQRQECTASELAQSSIETIRPLAKDKQIDFAVHLPEGLPRVSADQSRIAQVLNNLLGNALKFTSSGGQIELNVDRRDQALMFSVRDNGPGIQEEALPHLFEPYWQVSRTRTGMGLGLFIAKTLVEAHGGRIWVETKLGQGTTFYFTLPPTTQTNAADRAAPDDETVSIPEEIETWSRNKFWKTGP
jgi:signal transduction histidine kinase